MQPEDKPVMWNAKPIFITNVALGVQPPPQRFPWLHFDGWIWSKSLRLSPGHAGEYSCLPRVHLDED